MSLWYLRSKLVIDESKFGFISKFGLKMFKKVLPRGTTFVFDIFKGYFWYLIRKHSTFLGPLLELRPHLKKDRGISLCKELVQL